MRVSFDGQSPEENDTLRVGADFYEQAQQVKDLAGSRYRPRQITIFNAGTGKVPDYLTDFFEGCEVVFKSIKMKNWARLDHAPLPDNAATHCRSLFETFTILSNGDVVMCCDDLQADDVIGSVLQNSPLELWERMEERRDTFSRKEYPRLCQSCWVTSRR